MYFESMEKLLNFVVYLNAAIYKIKYETCWSSKKKDTFISLKSKFNQIDYVYNFRDTLYISILFTKLPSIFISPLKLKSENSTLHRFIFKYQFSRTRFRRHPVYNTRITNSASLPLVSRIFKEFFFFFASRSIYFRVDARPRASNHPRWAWALKRARVTTRLGSMNENVLRAITRGSSRSSTRNRDGYYMLERGLPSKTIFRAESWIISRMWNLVIIKKRDIVRYISIRASSFLKIQIDGKVTKFRYLNYLPFIKIKQFLNQKLSIC